MNTTARSAGAIAGVILLGVTAVGAGAFGALMPVVGFLGGETLGGSAGTAAVVVGIALAIVSFTFAATAAFAARATYAGRPVGSMVGIGVGVVTVLGAAVATASGGWHPAQIAAYILGGGVTASLAAELVADATRSARG